MSASSKKPGYETKDVNLLAISLLTALLFVILGLTFFIARRMDRLLDRFSALHDQPPSPLTQLHQLPPEPRLQVDPAVDLIRLRDVENVRLNSYGWVAGQDGKAHIPIARAMAILAERGLPARNAEVKK